jgi:ureidoacrylate peracid hydrolase
MKDGMLEILDTLEAKVDPKSAALLVIDVQNDFCHSDGWMARSGGNVAAIQAMVPRIDSFIEQARSVGIRIVFIQAQYDTIYASRPIRERQRRRGESGLLCQTGSWGFELYRLERRPEDIVVLKHRYSAFIRTDLEIVLNQMGVESLILTGVVTNGCVESTARDGFMLDYYVVLVSDCCATYDQALHNATLVNVERLFGVVHTASEVVAAWDPVRAKQPLPMIVPVHGPVPG